MHQRTGFGTGAVAAVIAIAVMAAAAGLIVTSPPGTLSKSQGESGSRSASTYSAIATSLVSSSTSPIGLNCTVDISAFQSFQNQTASISFLSQAGFSSNSSAYLAIEPINITRLDIQMTKEPAFQQTVAGYVWVRAGWGPYTQLLTNSSSWGTYFPYASVPRGQSQNLVTPRGVAFWYEVYAHSGIWLGSFLGAYDLEGGNSTISPFHPHPQCPVFP